MTLKKYILTTQQDYDVYDTEYDACITICYWGKVIDNYDRFIDILCSKVPVKSVNGNSLVAPWSELISLNLDIFKAFTKDNWSDNCQYQDDIDEFKYQWIRELSAYVAGEVPESFYTDLATLMNKLESVPDIDEKTAYFKS